MITLKIDIECEGPGGNATSNGWPLITLTEAAAMIPSKRGGRKISVRTLERWVRYGHRGVFLAAARLGGAFFTTREAIQNFNVGCMGADRTRFAVPDSCRPANAAKAVSPAMRDLQRAGWASRNT